MQQSKSAQQRGVVVTASACRLPLLSLTLSPPILSFSRHALPLLRFERRRCRHMRRCCRHHAEKSAIFYMPLAPEKAHADAMPHSAAAPCHAMPCRHAAMPLRRRSLAHYA